MSLPIPIDLLDPVSLTGRSAAQSIWRHKTKNIFRGVFELDCTGRSPSEIFEQVIRIVEEEYDPGFFVPFAFGVVLHFSSEAPPPSQLESFIDDRARNRGTWQWLVVVDQARREAYGIHMWANGYLTPVFEVLLGHLDGEGYTVTKRLKLPGKFWTNLWATMRSLVAARKALVPVGVVLGLLLLLHKVFVSR
ncbi:MULTISPECIES: hypothetical protein [unclassified Duganella]|uniref:hypothetical protein n=1 Tax=unclassified Duganella TaxID=2636909 RepID=UPI000B84868B|nr:MULTISPECIES: hypothetical protein [unclassified Duganella]